MSTSNIDADRRLGRLGETICGEIKMSARCKHEPVA